MQKFVKMIDRMMIRDRYMKFECRTAAAPKKGGKMVFRANEQPTNLAEMLTMLRQMGYRPEDISVSPMSFEYNYDTITSY